MDNQNQNVLDDNRIGHLLFRLSLPAFMGMFVMTLYNVVDTIFIGHYVGPLGIAGLSIVFPIQMLTMGIGQMTGMGGASLISRLIGAGNTPRAENALGNALTFTIIISVALTITGLSNPDLWLRLMGASDTILPYARDYMTIILTAVFFRTFAMSQNFLIRATGNARVPMIGMIMGAGLNIVLDAIFIIPLGMGVKGAALATVIAQLITSLYFLRYYLSGKSFLRVHLQNMIIEWDILKSILAIGISSFARTAAQSLAVVFVNRTLLTLGGDLAISSYGLIQRIMMFALMPGIVIGQGMQPILGFNYGAGRYDRALKVIKIAIIAATSYSVIAFCALYFAPGLFIRVFTADSELIVLAAQAARSIFFAAYLIGFIIVGSIIFQAIGKAPQAFVTAIARPALFLLPLVFILPNYWQVDGVWLAFPITDALTSILVLILLIPEIKMFRRNEIRQI
ncbi:MAG: MATE family efflux transporter [Dehalococcoidia bacterium]